MKKLILVLMMLTTCCFAQSFDFNSKGDEKANEVLKEYVAQELDMDDFDAIAYFCDINHDGRNEIIGIAKAAPFYSLAGYQLFILKDNGTAWENIKTDIYFDNLQDISVHNSEITYHKTSFYRNKKYKAKFKKDEFITNNKFADFFTNKKVSAIQQVTTVQKTGVGQVMDIDDLKGSDQPSFYLDLTNY